MVKHLFHIVITFPTASAAFIVVGFSFFNGMTYYYIRIDFVHLTKLNNMIIIDIS